MPNLVKALTIELCGSVIQNRDRSTPRWHSSERHLDLCYVRIVYLWAYRAQQDRTQESARLVPLVKFWPGL